MCIYTYIYIYVSGRQEVLCGDSYGDLIWLIWGFALTMISLTILFHRSIEFKQNPWMLPLWQGLCSNIEVVSSELIVGEITFEFVHEPQTLQSYIPSRLHVRTFASWIPIRRLLVIDAASGIHNILTNCLNCGKVHGEPHVFKSNASFCDSRWSLTRQTTHKTNEAVLDKSRETTSATHISSSKRTHSEQAQVASKTKRITTTTNSNTNRMSKYTCSATQKVIAEEEGWGPCLFCGNPLEAL